MLLNITMRLEFRSILCNFGDKLTSINFFKKMSATRKLFQFCIKISFQQLLLPFALFLLAHGLLV